MGIEDADHEESNPTTSRPLISKLSYSLVGTSECIKLQADTLAHQVYGKEETVERYSCSYGLNSEYQEQISQGELKFVGHNDEGEIRVIELEGHRYFIASLFLPQMNSNSGNPHPMIMKYLEEALIFGGSR